MVAIMTAQRVANVFVLRSEHLCLIVSPSWDYDPLFAMEDVSTSPLLRKRCAWFGSMTWWRAPGASIRPLRGIRSTMHVQTKHEKSQSHQRPSRSPSPHGILRAGLMRRFFESV